jgi:hypothetical protein
MTGPLSAFVEMSRIQKEKTETEFEEGVMVEEEDGF